MNVNNQIFENTKETILRNKLQFIKAQLSEIEEKKQLLRIENKGLKAQIRNIKTQKTFKSKKNTLIAHQKAIEDTDKDMSIKRHKLSLPIKQGLKRKASNNDQNEKQNKNVNININNKQQESFRYALPEKFEQTINNQNLLQLESLQIKISQLKEACQAQKAINIAAKQLNSNKYNNQLQNSVQKLIGVKNTARQCQQRKDRKTMSVNLPGQRESEKAGMIGSVSSQHEINSSNYKFKNQHYKIMRQTEVDLGRGQNRSHRNNNSHAHYQIKLNDAHNKLHSKKQGTSQFVFGGNKIVNKSLSNNLCFPAKFSGSQSGTLALSRRSSSNHSNFTSFLNSSKLSNSSNNSVSMSNYRSYEKIITSIECEGCQKVFKPNQYYKHIEECRQYLLLKLQRQKQEIDSKIFNQTLNLSVSYV